MGRKSRTTILIFILGITVLMSASGQESWQGPVLLKDFAFDRMSLYAIGWSEKGLFAYGTVRTNEDGRYYWQWFIQDLVEDAVLYRSPEWLLLEAQSPARLWKLHPEWYPQLLRFGIKTKNVFHAGGQIFDFQNDSFRMSFFLDRSESSDYPGGFTKEIRIDLIRNQNTAKTVYSHSPSKGEDYIEDLILKGHVLSPHEKRCALVALEKIKSGSHQAQWQYRIIGAHLGVGFTQLALDSSALAEAVLNGQFYVCRMLLSEGADPEALDSRGYSPVLIAARLGHWSILNLLLAEGSTAGHQDDQGRTALHYAVEASQVQSIKLLLSAGADPNLKDKKGHSPGYLARLGENSRIKALFPR